MPAVTKSHCNTCGHSVNHDVIGSDKDEFTDEEDGTVGYDLYEMLKCRGCGCITLRHTSALSSDESPAIEYYPPAISRRRPEWVTYDIVYELMGGTDIDPIPTPICAMMREIYTAV